MLCGASYVGLYKALALWSVVMISFYMYVLLDVNECEWQYKIVHIPVLMMLMHVNYVNYVNLTEECL